MIIWSGVGGILVVVILFAALILTEMAFEGITGDDQFYQQHGWVRLIGMLVAAAMTYGLHKLLLLEKGRVVIDKKTGQEVVQRPHDSLFFIPVKWWPVVFVILGLMFAVVEPQAGAEPDRAAMGQENVN